MYIHWFRSDLRLWDNHALSVSLDLAKNKSDLKFLWIWDKNITSFNSDNIKIKYLTSRLDFLKSEVEKHGFEFIESTGKPTQIFATLLDKYKTLQVFANEDYSPYSKSRDKLVSELLNLHDSELNLFKDSTIFPDIINSKTKLPYKVLTYYKTEWLNKLNIDIDLKNYSNDIFLQSDTESFDEFLSSKIYDYHKSRDLIAENGTSKISHLLKFGVISIRYVIREIVKVYLESNLDLKDFRSLKLNPKFSGVESYLSEIIWREFYKMILNFYPEVAKLAFQEKYRKLNWDLNFEDIVWQNEIPVLKTQFQNNSIKLKAYNNFLKFINSQTGFELVDAGIAQLNLEYWMHNRVRMIIASFLTKDLHIDWRLGKYYFKLKLLDWDLASNNGGWQWSAGVGTDAAPYFRIFNPDEQAEKYDPKRIYRDKYLKERDKLEKMIDHKLERVRALERYQSTSI
ncbi:deoxyribodipyrimidine photo-lyase [bacterium]|nr:MAG: deoxyribodipyrimidine photo-lyase [bacterium]